MASVVILHNDKAGLAAAVETVRNSQELVRETIADPEDLWAT